MASENSVVEARGVVQEVLPGFSFRVELDNGATIIAKGGGRLRKKRIRISVLDKVLVEMSIYDLTRGRICRRIDDYKPPVESSRT